MNFELDIEETAKFEKSNIIVLKSKFAKNGKRLYMKLGRKISVQGFEGFELEPLDKEELAKIGLTVEETANSVVFEGFYIEE